MRTLQDGPLWLTDVAQLVTMVGDQEFYLLVFPLLYWSVHRRLGLQLAVILLLSASVNAVLKLAVASPRPGYIDPGLAVIDPTGYGVPSGHTQNGVALWGLLAAERGGRRAWAASGTLVALLAWSRLQLGAHFPVDVVTGFVVGALLLAGYLRTRGPVAAWFLRHPFGRQVAIVLGAALTLVALGVLARATGAGTTVPADWVGVDPAHPPYRLDAVVTAPAALFGLVTGALWIERHGGHRVDGRWWQRAVRYPAGLLGVVAIDVGLGAVEVPDEALSLALRFVRFALVGLWIGAGAPLLFDRLRLVDRDGVDVTGGPARRGSAG